MGAKMHSQPMTSLDLIAFRATRGLTMARAAAMFGIPYNTWRGWELGRAMGSVAGPLGLLLQLADRAPMVFEGLSRADVEGTDEGTRACASWSSAE